METVDAVAETEIRLGRILKRVNDSCQRVNGGKKVKAG